MAADVGQRAVAISAGIGLGCGVTHHEQDRHGEYGSGWSLTSVAEVGLLVAFLFEAITDPAAAATQVEDAINPIANEVYAGLADVLGALYGKAAA